jgi:hypothetical protein
MLLKYVGSKPITLEDFKTEKNEPIELYPSDTVDLSYYTQKERNESIQLRTLFEIGDMICLGAGQKVEQKKALVDKAQLRQEALNLNQSRDLKGQFLVQGRTRPETPLFSLDKRKHMPRSPVTPERYNQEANSQYEQQMQSKYFDQFKEPIPQSEESEAPKRTTHSFVQLQNENEIRTFKWNHNTLEVDQHEEAPGVIDIRHITSDTFVDRNDYNKKPEAKFVPTADLEKIQEKVNSRCLSLKTNGQICQNRVMKGYDHCWTHLPTQQRVEYQQMQKEKFFGKNPLPQLPAPARQKDELVKV